MTKRIENPRVGGSIPSLGTNDSAELGENTSTDTVGADPSKSAAIQAAHETPNHILSTGAWLTVGELRRAISAIPDGFAVQALFVRKDGARPDARELAARWSDFPVFDRTLELPTVHPGHGLFLLVVEGS